MVHVMFFISLAAMIVNSVILLKGMHEEAEKKLNSKLVVVSETIVLVTLLLALIDIIGFINFGAYRHSIFFIGAVSLAEYLFYLLYKKFPVKILRFAGKIVAAAAVLELTVFNIPAYHLFGGGYDEQKLKLSEAEIEVVSENPDDENNVEYNQETGTIFMKGNNELILRFSDVGSKVGSIYADVSFGDWTSNAEMKVDTKDETNQGEYRFDIINQKVLKERENSAYALCNLSGKVSDLSLKFQMSSDHNELTVHDVYINKQIPIAVSWVRFLLITVLAVLIYSFTNTKVMQKEYNDNRKFCGRAVAVITACFCIASVLIINYKNGEKTWSEVMQQTEGNQMSQELVEAFSEGQTNIISEVPEGLEELENPYDRTLREPVVGYEMWDHVYYNGNFYSYYGIAPVVLLFWPYHALTGYYFPDNAAVMIMAIIGMIGLAMVYLAFVRKWFKKLPTGMVIAGMILFQTVSGIWFSIGRPDFYEVAMSFGFAFLTWGVYFLLESNIIGSGEISPVKTAVASFLMATAVLCRPTLAVYCICAAVFMVLAFKRSGLTSSASIGKTAYSTKKRIVYSVCAVVPMLVLGGIQMWYNYSRFGSPFDFGIQYSLTINDFTRSEYHTAFVFVALFNYLLNPPVFSMAYPFVTTEFSYLDSNGFFYMDYSETYNTSGLFFLALPMFMYLLSGKAYKRLPDRKTKLSSLLYIGLPCVIMPIIIIGSVWESGYAVRYMVDFSWQMLLGAFAVMFFLYLKTENETIKKMFRYFLNFSMIWALFVNGMQFIRQAFSWFPEIAYSVEQMIAFWK